jgi:hypothetical protein
VKTLVPSQATASAPTFQRGRRSGPRSSATQQVPSRSPIRKCGHTTQVAAGVIRTVKSTALGILLLAPCSSFAESVYVGTDGYLHVVATLSSPMGPSVRPRSLPKTEEILWRRTRTAMSTSRRNGSFSIAVTESFWGELISLIGRSIWHLAEPIVVPYTCSLTARGMQFKQSPDFRRK